MAYDSSDEEWEVCDIVKSSAPQNNNSANKQDVDALAQQIQTQLALKNYHDQQQLLLLQQKMKQQQKLSEQELATIQAKLQQISTMQSKQQAMQKEVDEQIKDEIPPNNSLRKQEITEMLTSMGMQPNYIQRAFKVYEKNYGNDYNVEVITEIIVRLQNKDKSKQIMVNSQNDQKPNINDEDTDNNAAGIQRLCSLGFERIWVDKALILTNNNVDYALEWLLSDEFKHAKDQQEKPLVRKENILDDKFENMMLQQALEEKSNNYEKDEKQIDIVGPNVMDTMRGRDDKLQLNDVDGAKQQFWKFLKENRLDKYYKKFEENDCCDIRDVEYLLNDENFLKHEIGMKNPIERSRFLGECEKLKNNMEQFKDLKIPSILLKKLVKYGIVTMDILCNEVQNKNDLQNKFDINNAKQRDLLWNVINAQLNPQSNPNNNNEHENEGINPMDDNITAYI